MFGGDAYVTGYCLDSGPVGQDGTDQGGLPGPIPAEYLPTYAPPNPWQHSGPHAQQDFILIAEFSEQEGPKPLITIPKGADTGFDLNEFSVRIMSVDFQTMASDTFTMVEDTQIIISESRDSIYAYVHHFTLTDSQARGFVRPFCMSYITTDHRKLISFYNEMASEFSKVSRYFKYGNLMLFVKDMTHYLTDLQFTRERFMERQAEVEEAELEGRKCRVGDAETAEDAIFRSMNIVAVENCIREVKMVLETASSNLTDQRLEKRFRHLEDKSREERLMPMSEHAQYSTSLTNGSPRRSLSWLNLRRAKSGSFSEGESNSFNLNKDPVMYRPKLVRTINRRRFDKALRTLHELCQWGAKDGLNRLRSIHKYFSRELATLEIERRESHLIDPPATLLTLGRNVTVNFLSNIDVDLSGNNWPLAQNHARTGQSTNNLLRRWLSDDTLASFHSVDSFLSCQEELTTPPTTAQSSYEPAFVLGSAYVEERDSLCSLDMLSIASKDDVDAGRYMVTMVRDDSSLNMSDMSATESMDFDEEEEKGRRGLSNAKASPQRGGRNMNYSESTKDITEEKPQRVSVISAADHITNLTPTSPGYGILRFMTQHPYSPHIVYSLLRGRPMVVVGSSKSEQEVKAAVNALWLFVPGHSNRSHMVVPWHTRPLRITDLAMVKLVGICRPDRRSIDYIIPLSIKRYVSILDLEKKTLCAPAYESGIITGIYTKRRHIRCEKAYIAYIHSVLLELASKSHIFYHSYCINSPASNLLQRGYSWCEPAHRDQARNAEQEFMTKLKVNEHDSHIIKYFVEVVKLQQVEEIHLHSSSDKELPCPTVKLDFSQCSVFKAAK